MDADDEDALEWSEGDRVVRDGKIGELLASVGGDKLLNSDGALFSSDLIDAFAFSRCWI